MLIDEDVRRAVGNDVHKCVVQSALYCSMYVR